MITIRKSPTADTRTCDYPKVSKHTLLTSSLRHIADVALALQLFEDMLLKAGSKHDSDRHHCQEPDRVPLDVNLIDVLEMIADCVMAGMARSGSVYQLRLNPEVLEAAFQNTVELLKQNVEVEEGR